MADAELVDAEKADMHDEIARLWRAFRRLVVLLLAVMVAVGIGGVVFGEYLSGVAARRDYVDTQIRKLNDGQRAIFCLVPPVGLIANEIRRQAGCGPYIAPHHGVGAAPSSPPNPSRSATSTSVGLPVSGSTRSPKSIGSPHPSTSTVSVTRIAPSPTVTRTVSVHPSDTSRPTARPTPSPSSTTTRPGPLAPLASLICVVTVIVHTCPTSS